MPACPCHKAPTTASPEIAEAIANSHQVIESIAEFH
jgi:hypothetical protein